MYLRLILASVVAPLLVLAALALACVVFGIAEASAMVVMR